MMVKCRKTGRMYDPELGFEKLLKESWVIAIMKRLRFR